MPALSGALRPVVVRALLLNERLRSGAVFNPLDRRYHQDPFPAYARLRDRDPVHWSALTRSWVITRFDDIDAILRDHRRFSNDARTGRRGERARMHELQPESPSLLGLDPPDHTRLRSLVSRAFTRPAIEAWRPRIEQVVDRLLDEIGSERRFDLMSAIANPLPVVVIAEMLGVPPGDFERLKAWSDDLARTLEPTIRPAEVDRAMRAREELRHYFSGIVEARRREPREDLVSVLAAAEEGGDQLSREELLTMLVLLLAAGNETTTNLIGNGMLALLRDSDQHRWLRDRPEAAETAIEELLRFDSPVQADGRTVLEDLEIDGRSIREGDQVILLLGAGNRDPARYPDPDRLRLDRGDKNHLAFGRGIHHCLGAPLARLEGQVVFPALLERFPTMRLADPAPRFRDHVVLRGLRELPVEV